VELNPISEKLDHQCDCPTNYFTSFSPYKIQHNPSATWRNLSSCEHSFFYLRLGSWYNIQQRCLRQFLQKKKYNIEICKQTTDSNPAIMAAKFHPYSSLWMIKMREPFLRNRLLLYYLSRFSVSLIATRTVASCNMNRIFRCIAW
jgi:hypothetical protein